MQQSIRLYTGENDELSYLLFVLAHCIKKKIFNTESSKASKQEIRGLIESQLAFTFS